MKNVLKTVFALSVILFTSCEGPEGPPGFDGLDGRDGLNGLDGINVTATLIDVEGSFNSANDFSFFYDFQDDVDTNFDFAVLAYLREREIELEDGSFTDVWRPLPTTILSDQGIYQYNFEHTFFDIEFFMEGDFDLSTLNPDFLNNQVFRIALVPADLLANGEIDVTRFGESLNKIEINSSTPTEISL